MVGQRHSQELVRPGAGAGYPGSSPPAAPAVAATSDPAAAAPALERRRQAQPHTAAVGGAVPVSPLRTKEHIAPQGTQAADAGEGSLREASDILAKDSSGSAQNNAGKVSEAPVVTNGSSRYEQANDEEPAERGPDSAAPSLASAAPEAAVHAHQQPVEPARQAVLLPPPVRQQRRTTVAFALPRISETGSFAPAELDAASAVALADHLAAQPDTGIQPASQPAADDSEEDDAGRGGAAIMEAPEAIDDDGPEPSWLQADVSEEGPFAAARASGEALPAAAPSAATADAAAAPPAPPTASASAGAVGSTGGTGGSGSSAATAFAWSDVSANAFPRLDPSACSSRCQFDRNYTHCL